MEANFFTWSQGRRRRRHARQSVGRTTDGVWIRFIKRTSLRSDIRAHPSEREIESVSKQAISFLHPNLLVTARTTKVLLDQWRPAAATYRSNKKESVPRPDRITSNATGRQTACKQCTSSFSTQPAALPSPPPPPPPPRREPYARLLQFIVQRDHQMFRKIVLLSSSTTVVVFHVVLGVL